MSMHSINLRKRGLIAITWPILIEQLSHIMPGIIDTVMVSQLGAPAVAGLAVANQIVVFCITLFSIVSIGCGVVLTHHLGSGDRSGAEQVASTAVAANFWMGTGVSVLICLFSGEMLDLLHLPAILMPFAQPFLALMGGTLFLEALNIAFGAVLRAHGQTRDAMLVTLGMNGLNVGLNFLLIFGMFGFPKLGVVGAALSTVISRACACIALAWLARRDAGLQLRAATFWRCSRRYLGKILHIGLPAAGEILCWLTSLMVITYFIAQMGVSALATFSYTMQLAPMMSMVSGSIGIGTGILIGHMVGAGHINEAYRQLLTSLRTGLAATMGAACLVALMAPHLLKLLSDNQTIVATGVLLLRMGLILEPGRTFNQIVIGALRAAGDTRFPVLMGIVSMWGLSVPLAWWLGLHLGWGLPGIWIAFAADEWARGIMMYVRWKSRAWEPHAIAVRSRVAAA